ncbi:MAG TPA: hypothetical protein VGL66_11575 [Caulobacteraceae bacterium]|jgi:hypothetical protein
MAIFVVLAKEPSPQLGAKIAQLYPGDNHYKINDDQWLVSADKLASTISTDLEFPGGKAGVSGVVFPISGKGWGWHNTTLWEWLTLKGASK